MRVKITLVVALLAAVTAVVVGQESPFVGRWNLKGTGPDTDKVYWLEVKQNGSQLEGRFLNRSAHATPLGWIRVEGNELVFQYGRGEGTPDDPVEACGPIYRARLENGKLIGHHTPEPCPPRGRAGQPAAAPKAPAPPPATPPPPAKPINWVGVRQPVWPPSNANGTHTYGTPVVIVGPGVAKETWSGNTPDTWQRACADRWTIENGALKNETPKQGEQSTCNIYTKERFKDFKADAEFKLDYGQNSGFYLRGRYELQLSLSATPEQQRANSRYPGLLMDIYGWKRADVYAGLPAEEWQVLNLVVVGNHLTATLNGKRVHDNAVLPAMTGGAMDNDELAPGPIMIQGDHSRVAFRKLVVTPITKAGT